MRRTPEVFGSRENTNKHGCNGRLQHIFSSSSYTGGVLHLHILPRPAFNRYRRAYHQVSCFLQLLSIQQVAKKRGPKPPGTSFTVTSAAPPCHPCVVTSRARLFSQPFGAAEALFLALFRAAGTSSFNLSMRSRDRHLPMHHPRAHFGKKKKSLSCLYAIPAVSGSHVGDRRPFLLPCHAARTAKRKYFIPYILLGAMIGQAGKVTHPIYPPLPPRLPFGSGFSSPPSSSHPLFYFRFYSVLPVKRRRSR